MDFSWLESLQGDSDFLYNLLAFLLGLGLHVGKKCYQEKVSLREYLEGHKLNTYLSLTGLASLMSYLQLSYPGAPFVVYLMAGYSVDSLLNKVPLSPKKIEQEKGK